MNERVLLMDTHQPTCAQLPRKLSQSGYQVDIAASIPDTVLQAVVRKYDYLLIHIDTMMGMDAEKLMHRLRMLHPDLRLVMLVEDGWGPEQAPFIRLADAVLFKNHLPGMLRMSLEAMAG